MNYTWVFLLNAAISAEIWLSFEVRGALLHLSTHDIRLNFNVLRSCVILVSLFSILDNFKLNFLSEGCCRLRVLFNISRVNTESNRTSACLGGP